MCCEAGVYRRQVVDWLGVLLWILIPRFLCRGLGPRRPEARTFSVLPADVLPRRKWSLGWMLTVAMLCSDSLVEALDRLSEMGMAVEARQLRRMLEVLGVICERLHEHPLEGVEVRPAGSRREQALEAGRVCQSWEASGRGPPGRLVMAWNLRWDSLLMDIRVR